MRRPAWGSLAFFASFSLLGQNADIPLTNWTVPPYTNHSSGGITTMTDATPPRAFVGIQPCRVADTRGNGAPIQGGILNAAETRTWDLTGICGIPAGADAISGNFTVTGAPTAPPGSFILAWPTGGPIPPVSILNFQAGQTIANAAIVPLGAGEQINVNTSATVHVILDVNGYFSDQLGNVTNQFLVINNIPGNYTGAFGNFASAVNSSGVVGTAGPGFPHPAYLNAGVRGESQLTGVLGLSQTRGVLGSVVNAGGGEIAYGVLGFDVTIADPAISGQDVGVFGHTGSSAAQAGAVIGYAPAGSGAVAGVRGVIGSQSAGAAGVRGQDGGGSVPLAWPGPDQSAGVRGESHNGHGVLGISDNYCGVRGSNTGGTSTCLGYIGGDGAVVQGDLELYIGSKNFIEPHPTDASKLIRYASLEGNESGTYFRGRGKFQNGVAIIEVPEDFRMVTDPEGLSIQVTPIRGMATVSVESIDLDRIVVRGSRNVEFFYTVNGIRRAYKDLAVIIDNKEILLPQSPDDRMPQYVPPVLRERLISNGTYNADGTVNLETARRLGWDKMWEKRSRRAPQPAEP